jgi:hypothetical protein
MVKSLFRQRILSSVYHVRGAAHAISLHIDLSPNWRILVIGIDLIDSSSTEYDPSEKSLMTAGITFEA